MLTVGARAARLSYVGLGALLLALLMFTAVADEWVSDTWIHTATITEVARHPWHPAEPLTGSDVPFPYYSPWAMALGWLVRAAGLSVFTALTISGLVAAVLLLAAWWRLVRAFTAARWAPVVGLVLMLTLWGAGATWFWSGFPVLGTWSVGFTWPSLLATAGWFELWRTAVLLPEVRTRRQVAVFVSLPGLLLLVHPFTAAIAGVAVAVTLLGHLRRHRHLVARATGYAVASLTLAFAWPWMALRTLFPGPALLDETHRMLYDDLSGRYLLLALAVPAVALRLVRNRLDPLAGTALVCLVGVAAGWPTHWYSLARLAPGVAIPAQLALAVMLTAGWSAPRALRRRALAGLAVLTAATCLAVAMGTWSNRWVAARVLPGETRRAHYERVTAAQLPYPDVSFVTRFVGRDDVVVTNDWRIRRQLPTYGARPLSIPWPVPGFADAEVRVRGEDAILDPDTAPAERHRIMRHHQVRWIVWSPTHVDRTWPYPGARTVACGPSGVALLAVDSSATAAGACPAPGAGQR